MAEIGNVALIGTLVTGFIVVLLASLICGFLLGKMSRWKKWPISPKASIAFGAAIVPLILSFLALSTYLRTTEGHVSQGYGLLYLYPTGLALFAWLVIWPVSFFALLKHGAG